MPRTRSRAFPLPLQPDEPGSSFSDIPTERHEFLDIPALARRDGTASDVEPAWAMGTDAALDAVIERIIPADEPGVAPSPAQPGLRKPLLYGFFGCLLGAALGWSMHGYIALDSQTVPMANGNSSANAQRLAVDSKKIAPAASTNAGQAERKSVPPLTDEAEQDDTLLLTDEAEQDDTLLLTDEAEQDDALLLTDEAEQDDALLLTDEAEQDDADVLPSTEAEGVSEELDKPAAAEGERGDELE